VKELYEQVVTLVANMAASMDCRHDILQVREQLALLLTLLWEM
jgi:hypothetical protein